MYNFSGKYLAKGNGAEKVDLDMTAFWNYLDLHAFLARSLFPASSRQGPRYLRGSRHIFASYIQPR